MRVWYKRRKPDVSGILMPALVSTKKYDACHNIYCFLSTNNVTINLTHNACPLFSRFGVMVRLSRLFHFGRLG
jgi:hypothetical protein